MLTTLKRNSMWLFYAIFPPAEARYARILLRQQLDQEEVEIGSTSKRYLDWFDLSNETLQRLLREEDARASALEDKSAKVSVVLGIGLTIGGTIGKSLADGVSIPWLRIAVFVGLLIAMLYLLWGGWLAFRSGMTAKPRMAIGADWAVEAQKKRKSSRIAALIHFEKTNLIRNNDISVAVDCVRNGLIVFAAVVVMVLSAPLLVMVEQATANEHRHADPMPKQSAPVAKVRPVLPLPTSNEGPTTPEHHGWPCRSRPGATSSRQLGFGTVSAALNARDSTD